ncbi:Uu.00g051680.m01.CDS01 [Anthostomella pinea]|uniref:Uu.00g051680.m01.CDS01 n=1 Tax=Anthostomella pinea TaxID=933095 RepID=A0AAI8YPB8_9PEZI|nr:Uu.00g051680.m01.CDS01 [Anthostomella pinea]
MATTTTTTSPPAPWRSLFLEHVQAMSSPEFVLSTVRKVPSPTSSGSSSSSYSPRGRTCIFRGLWADLPVNPKNDAELNPDGVWESDFPTFTTDCRMDKMAELWEEEEEGAGGGEEEKEKKEKIKERIAGSGGGARVEAMWWAKEPSVQWRVRGRGYVLGPDVEESQGGKDAVAALESRMRKKKHNAKEEGGQKDWSPSREVTAHFGNLSPMMRGTFRNPPSGTPVALPVGGGLALGQKVTNVTDEVARANFRVVVIVPDEVDRCDLSDPARGRRWLYTYVGANNDKSQPQAPGGQIEGEWEKVEVWP